MDASTTSKTFLPHKIRYNMIRYHGALLENILQGFINHSWSPDMLHTAQAGRRLQRSHFSTPA
jgi:hypothetical protein